MNEAGRNLGEEVECGIRSNGDDCRHAQPEDQQWQQKHAAAESGEADQRAYNQADKDLERDQFHRVAPVYAPVESAGSGLTPMKPCCSRCRMISCAASSALSSAVLMTTSASAGDSYGSEIPVNSLTMPARAFA